MEYTTSGSTFAPEILLSVNKIEAEIQKGKKNIYNIKFSSGNTLSNGEILQVFRKDDEIKDLNGN